MAITPFWQTNYTDTDGVLATAHVPTVVGSSPLVHAPGSQFSNPNGLHVASNDLVQVNLTSGIGNDNVMRIPVAPATNKYRSRHVLQMPASGTIATNWGVNFRLSSSDLTGYAFVRDNGVDRFRLWRSDGAGAGTLLATIDAGTPANGDIFTMDVGCHDAHAQDRITCRLQRTNGDYLTTGGTWTSTPSDCIDITDGSPITAAGFAGFQVRAHTASIVVVSSVAEQEAPVGTPGVRLSLLGIG